MLKRQMPIRREEQDLFAWGFHGQRAIFAHTFDEWAYEAVVTLSIKEDRIPAKLDTGSGRSAIDENIVPMGDYRPFFMSGS
jgi:hypothetical protein